MICLISFLLVSLPNTTRLTPKSLKNLTASIFNVEACVDREDLAMIIEEVLKQRIEGVKNEEGVYITPAFSKFIK